MRMSKNIVSSRAVHAAFCVLFVAVLCGGSIPLADLEDVRDVLRASQAGAPPATNAVWLDAAGARVRSASPSTRAASAPPGSVPVRGTTPTTHGTMSRWCATGRTARSGWTMVPLRLQEIQSRINDWEGDNAHLYPLNLFDLRSFDRISNRR